jgi:hypothetical protein
LCVDVDVAIESHLGRREPTSGYEHEGEWVACDAMAATTTHRHLVEPVEGEDGRAQVGVVSDFSA